MKKRMNRITVAWVEKDRFLYRCDAISDMWIYCGCCKKGGIGPHPRLGMRCNHCGAVLSQIERPASKAFEILIGLEERLNAK